MDREKAIRKLKRALRKLESGSAECTEMEEDRETTDTDFGVKRIRRLTITLFEYQQITTRDDTEIPY